jgi:hypothetical protein
MPDRLTQLALRARFQLACEIVWTYLKIRWLMRRHDAARVVPMLRDHARQEAGAENPDLLLWSGWRLAKAVRRTLSPLPADSRCLYQSLTLLHMMERRGVDVSVVLAVRPSPFAAHAWVERDGKALLPPADPGYERLTEL